jgi:hypothetical protein
MDTYRALLRPVASASASGSVHVVRLIVQNLALESAIDRTARDPGQERLQGRILLGHSSRWNVPRGV